MLDASLSEASSGDGADLVVARLVGEFNFAESLRERRHVHAEPTAIALADAVPPADWIAFRPAPGLDSPFLGGLLLVGGAEFDLVALLDEPGVEILKASELIPQLSGIQPDRTT